MKKSIILGAALGGMMFLLAATETQARTSVSFSVNVGHPVVYHQAPVAYYPAPAYYAPPPVVYYHGPVRRVLRRPVIVHPGPVVYHRAPVCHQPRRVVYYR